MKMKSYKTDKGTIIQFIKLDLSFISKFLLNYLLPN